MSKKDNLNIEVEDTKTTIEDTAEETVETTPKEEKETAKVSSLEKALGKAEEQNKELTNKNLRLYAEFDNYRRRTAKERLELTKTAAKDVIKELLPILDDFERAFKAFENKDGVAEELKGFQLIYNKLKTNLEAKGLKAMEVKGKDFDADYHAALTEIPAPTEELKGKVVEEIEKGYYLQDTIIRHAKVIIGK